MSKIHAHMSIPEFLDVLDLAQLKAVEEMCKKRQGVITSEEKVAIYVFSSGYINEGFYSTEEEAMEALREYAKSEASSSDVLSVFETKQYPKEAQRLLNN